jgi:hypothetical protein
MIYALLGSNLFMMAIFIWRLGNLPPQLPLFYSRPWGEEQLADSWMILLLPAILDIFFFFNRYLQKKFFPDNQLVIKIIYCLNMTLIISFTLIFIKIIFLIT